VDVVLLGFIGGYIAGGWRTGFLRRLVGLGYAAVSLVAGAYLRAPVGSLIASIFGVPQEYGELIGYSVSFTALVVILNVISHDVLGKVAVSGLSRKADQALGAVLGGAEAIILVSAAIVILDTYFGPSVPPSQYEGLGFLAQLSQSLDASTTGQILRDTTVPFVVAILGPFLPKDVTDLIPVSVPTLPGGFPIPSP